MSKSLRIGLWNALSSFYWNRIYGKFSITSDKNMELIIKKIWNDFFELPIDDMNYNWDSIRRELKEKYLMLSWNEVYDFVEFVANNFYEDNLFSYEKVNQRFMDLCNQILKRELSAYRFIDGKIMPITNNQEIYILNEAVERTATAILKPVYVHLKTAFEELARPERPNYRNSVNESLNAIKELFRAIDLKNGNILDVLQTLDEKIGIPESLREGFKDMYGYVYGLNRKTLSLIEESVLSFDEAKFILVSCSAFINYILTKASEAGIRLK